MSFVVQTINEPGAAQAREAMGLSASEADALRSIASEFDQKSRASFEAERLLRREALFQSIEADEYPPAMVAKRASELSNRLNAVLADRVRLTEEHRTKLSNALSPGVLAKVESFVRERLASLTALREHEAPKKE